MGGIDHCCNRSDGMADILQKATDLMDIHIGGDTCHTGDRQSYSEPLEIWGLIGSNTDLDAVHLLMELVRGETFRFKPVRFHLGCRQKWGK